VNIFPGDKQSRLLELLGQELEVFRQVSELTKQHTKLLREDDIEAFDKSLDSRQELFDKINGLHQESDILMQSYISFISAEGGEKIGAIETAAAQLREMISDCLATNNENTTSAKEKAEDYIKQIGKLSLGRKSLGAYVQQMPNDPEMFDKKM